MSLSKSLDCSVIAPTLYYTSLTLKSTLLATTIFVSFFALCCKVESCLTMDEEGLKPVNQVWVSRFKKKNGGKNIRGDDVTDIMEKL